MRSVVTILAGAAVLVAAGAVPANPHAASPTVIVSPAPVVVVTAAPSYGITPSIASRTVSPQISYVLTNGVKFSNGYYYKGRNHCQWTHFTWNARYGCYFYYDNSALCWYYWCGAQDSYFPYSYIDTAPPTPQTPPVPPPPGSDPVMPFVSASK